jgi:hypothetical protein
VWEPYVRLNREPEVSTGGSGIGLSVVRELVTLHGGRTRAEGARGGGARLVIELPLAHDVHDAHDGHDGHGPDRPSAPASSDTSSPHSNVQLKAVP